MNMAIAPAEASKAAESAPEVLLDVRNVSLSFGGVQAIKDVSFNIHKGEIRAIIGPNGAGKTSMLNVINGFYHPQQGRIMWKGQVRQKMLPHIAASTGIVGATVITMTLIAFEKSLYGLGDVLLMVIVAAFALSTLFTYSYYGTKCLSFLTNAKIGKYYNHIYILSITFAAVASVDLVVNLIDLAFALMVIPNMIAVLYLAPQVNKAMKSYFLKAKNDTA